IHGYNHQADSEITIVCEIFANKEVELIITDQGTGIENIYEAKEPLYTSKPELERSGMGFSIMDSFMDSLEIYSTIDKETTLIMRKQLNRTETTRHKKSYKSVQMQVNPKKTCCLMRKLEH